jgi:hypothetical protein
VCTVCLRLPLLLTALLLTTSLRQGDPIPEAGRCWRFAFSSWDPPLDWARSGHGGKAGELSARIRRVRDSVFVRDSAAAANAAMQWERTSRGLAVVLFPEWWPVGVKVEFDSVSADGREMTGRATAFVADVRQEPARARARAVRCPA